MSCCSLDLSKGEVKSVWLPDYSGRWRVTVTVEVSTEFAAAFQSGRAGAERAPTSPPPGSGHSWLLPGPQGLVPDQAAALGPVCPQPAAGLWSITGLGLEFKSEFRQLEAWLANPARGGWSRIGAWLAGSHLNLKPECRRSAAVALAGRALSSVSELWPRWQAGTERQQQPVSQACQGSRQQYCLLEAILIRVHIHILWMTNKYNVTWNNRQYYRLELNSHFFHKSRQSDSFCPNLVDHIHFTSRDEISLIRGQGW